MSVDVVIPALFLAPLAVAAAFDLGQLRIPNWVNLALALLFLPALWLGPREVSLLAHAGTGALVLAAGLLMFAAGWLGGGDVKLAAACALWLGPGPQLAEFALWTALAGGVLVAWLGLGRAAARLGLVLLPPALRRGAVIPYGAAMAAGGAMVAARLPLI